MEFHEIEAFLAIARHENFTRAATELRLSQPAISRRIDLLEQELGSPLFERGRHGARLTDAGNAFLPFARQAIAILRDGLAAVAETQEGEIGSVTLALLGTLAGTDITAMLRRFRYAYPGIQVLLRTARSNDVGLMVETGEATIGLRYFQDQSSRLQSQTIAFEALVIVAAFASRLVPPGVTLRELARLPWVAFPAGNRSSGGPFTDLLTRELGRAGIDSIELIEIDSLTAQKRLIEADFGVGLLPASSVIEELRLGTLRRLAIPELSLDAPIVLLHRTGGYLSPAAQRLMSELLSSSAPRRLSVVDPSGTDPSV